MIRTRFPPEPNGYLHMGHIKSTAIILVSFEDNGDIKKEYTKIDDTNPKAEKQEYEDPTKDDVFDGLQT